MTTYARLGLTLSFLMTLPVCGGKKSNDYLPSMLRDNISVDLANVSALIALSGADNSGQALHAGLYTAISSSKALEDDSDAQSQLLALMQSGELLDVSLVEQGNPPGVVAIFPTSSWILFSAPAFRVIDEGSGDSENSLIVCPLIAARRADGALFCAPLDTNNPWNNCDAEHSIFSNAAGDVMFTMAGIATLDVAPDPQSFHLYRITLLGDEGPSAAPVFDFPFFALNGFHVNAAGDLWVNYFPTALDPTTTRSQIFPADGGTAFDVSGSNNGPAIPGRVGDADENSFYMLTNETTNEQVTLRVITKSGSTFVESQEVVNLEHADQYMNIARLSDGVYMFNPGDLVLARVIADGAVVANPTPVPLVDVDRIIKIPGHCDTEIYFAGDRMIFIAAYQDGYKFVRHDGATQQNIPLETGIDIWSFTVSVSGAIDFFGYRTSTSEKIHGTVAPDSIETTVMSGGDFDPGQVVTFTRIN